MVGVPWGQASEQGNATNYPARGIIREIKLQEHQLIIAHEAITNFMKAMTMPFNLKDDAVLSRMMVGDKIAFQLHVTASESWVDKIERLDSGSVVSSNAFAPLKTDEVQSAKISNVQTHLKNPLRNYKFTNELGQPVSLSDFRGQAIALTFFYTACPIPEFCPRLSRNFAAVQQRMSAMKNAPTNWHLISVSFDPGHDTPEALKEYGQRYQYDPAHWSFLTGPADKIAELARLCDVNFAAADGTINHNFRTLIIDSANHLQMVFPTSGDLSEAIVQELLKAADPNNQLTQATSNVHSQPLKQ